MHINFHSNLSEPCTQIYLLHIDNLHKYTTSIYNFNKLRLSDMDHPLPIFRPKLRAIGILDFDLPRKETISSNKRWTGRRRV